MVNNICNEKNVKIVYCGDPDKQFVPTAINNGFFYGTRFPTSKKICHQVYMANQNWKKPNREKYMKALKKYKPAIATVLDWEQKDQLSEVLDWANEASQFVEGIIIIPKVINGIKKLPRKVNGKKIILGYAVKSSYGSTSTPLWEFTNWDVHVLGGSPAVQMKTYLYLDCIANICSVDCNCFNKAAHFGYYWDNGWVESKDYEKDMLYRCFHKSCQNTIAEWKLFLEERGSNIKTYDHSPDAQIL